MTLHERNFIYGDIKPANFLLNRLEDGSIETVIADFGHMTHSNDQETLFATEGYMAPEVFHHKDDEIFLQTAEEKRASDLYSLEASLYELFINDEYPLHDIELAKSQGNGDFESTLKKLNEFYQSTWQCIEEPVERFILALMHPFASERMKGADAFKKN